MITFVINKNVPDAKPESPTFETIKDLSITVNGRTGTITRAAFGENILIFEADLDDKTIAKAGL